MKRPDRVPLQLSESLHHRLNAYALAATAAGVGVLALAQPSEARIVYTPAHHKIRCNTALDLDLNHDGTGDFRLINAFNTYNGCQGSGDAASFNVKALNSANQIWGPSHATHSSWASALSEDVRIGPSRRFDSRHARMAGWNHVVGSSFAWGYWIDVRDRYLGLKFVVNGHVHYGWARLNLRQKIGTQIVATLTGYAFETIPNKPIIAEKTKGPDVVTVQAATLGHLAAGASAIPAWRRAGANK